MRLAPGQAELPLIVQLVIVSIALTGAIDVDAATAALNGCVTADCAVIQRQRAMIIVDAAAPTVGERGRSIGDSQPGNGNVSLRENAKDAAGLVGIHGQTVVAGTIDSRRVVHNQFAAGQRDRLSV